MKKSICILLVTVLLLTLCACSRSDVVIDDKGEKTTSTSETEIMDDSIKELTLGCYNKFGYYDISGKLINFYDSENLKRIVLCNKPNCNHTDEECNAFLTSDLTENENNEFLVNADASFMFANNNRLYVFLTDGTVISMKYDGTEHRVETRIDDKYSLDRAFRYKNKIYINSYFSESDGGEIVEKAAFIIYDILKNEWVQGASFDRNLSGDSLVGITKCEEAVYFSSDEIRELPSGLSPSEAFAHQNKTKCRIYKTDIKTGKSVDIMEGTLGDCGAIQMLDGIIYCYSSNEKSLYSINPENSKKSTEYEGITGEVLLDKPIDNHLVVASSTDINSDASRIDFFDVETKKLTKAYELESNLDWNNNFRGIIGETATQFIMIYKADFTVDDEGVDVPYVSDMKAYVGVIDKADFWNEKYDFKEIEWF